MRAEGGDWNVMLEPGDSKVQVGPGEGDTGGGHWSWE